MEMVYIRAEYFSNAFESDSEKLDLSLFPCDQSAASPDTVINKKICSAEVDILFGHPESFLSGRGRELLKFLQYRKKVVACAVDEAHCIAMWR